MSGGSGLNAIRLSYLPKSIRRGVCDVCNQEADRYLMTMSAVNSEGSSIAGGVETSKSCGRCARHAILMFLTSGAPDHLISVAAILAATYIGGI